MTDEQLTAVAAEYACVPKRLPDGTVVQQAPHDKCYSGRMLTSNPPSYPWVCRRCGTKGADVGAYVGHSWGEYDQIVSRGRRYEPVPKQTAFDGLGVETPVLDLKALVKLLTRAAQGRPDPRVAEVGSWAGRTAITLADACPRATVYCVDTWEGTPQSYDMEEWGQGVQDDPTGALAQEHGPEKLFATFCRNMGSRLFRNVFPCRGPSVLWAASWPFAVDMVFLDGDHRYEAVKADIEAWRPHVRPGGIFCGHDFWICPGVNRAVEEAFGPVVKMPMPGQVFLAGHCLWWVQIGEAA